MNEIAKFNNLKVRINYVGSEPFFVAKDICEALYIKNVSQTLADLDSDEKQKITTIILNDVSKAKQKTQSVWHVSESGVYSLLLKSRKKEAKEFRKWVTKDVLPTIRETGGYSIKAKNESWLQKRIEGKGIRKTEMDIVKAFEIYANNQGANPKGTKRYYSTFTKEVYKALDIKKGERDNISGLKLFQLSTIEMTIANSLQRSMSAKMHYKECYQQAKKDFTQVAELAGFRVNNNKLEIN